MKGHVPPFVRRSGIFREVVEDFLILGTDL